MKKTLIYLAAGLGIASLTFNLFAFKSIEKANGQPNEHILVEVYEIPTYPDKGVHIHYGNKKTEVVPFKEFKKENHDENGEIIISTINRLEKEGYELTHVTGGLASAGMITKIFMVKRQ